MPETLSDYVNRILRQKGLSQKDVAERSGNIAKGYVSEIASGNVTNLSIDKLNALAKGLDVDVMEVCAVACGEGYSATGFDPLAFLDLMQRVLANQDIVEIHQNLLRLTKKERQAVLKTTRKMVKDKEA
jgi:transcriptional regulator with XRE-family HTH domain